MQCYQLTVYDQVRKLSERLCETLENSINSNIEVEIIFKVGNTVSGREPAFHWRGMVPVVEVARGLEGRQVFYTIIY